MFFSSNLLTIAISSQLQCGFSMAESMRTFIPTFFVLAASHSVLSTYEWFLLWWGRGFSRNSCHSPWAWGGTPPIWVHGVHFLLFSLLLVFVHLHGGRTGILHLHARTTLFSLRPFASSLFSHFHRQLSASRHSFLLFEFARGRGCDWIGLRSSSICLFYSISPHPNITARHPRRQRPRQQRQSGSVARLVTCTTVPGASAQNPIASLSIIISI
jgi:hypothetical protein